MQTPDPPPQPPPSQNPYPNPGADGGPAYPPPAAPPFSGVPVPYAYGGYPYPPPYAFVPVPPRVWTVFVAFVVAVVGGIVASVVVAVVALAVGGHLQAGASPEDIGGAAEGLVADPPVLFSLTLSTSLTLLGVALGAGVLSKAPLAQRLRVGPPRMPWYGYLPIVLGTLAISELSNIGIVLLGLDDVGVLKEFGEVFANLSGGDLVLGVIAVGFGAGICEEMFFRGYVQTRLSQRWGRAVSIAIASCLFGLMHMDPVQGPFALLIGLFFGLATERTGSILPAIVAHTVNNALSVIGGAYGIELSLGADLGTPGGLAAVAGACVVLLAVGLVFLLRLPAPELPPAPVSGPYPAPAYAAYGVAPPGPFPYPPAWPPPPPPPSGGAPPRDYHAG